MDELKPCPFCGGEARLLLNAKRKVYGKDEYRTGVVACCNVCEARMFYGSEKLAIEAWNRRQPQRKTGSWTEKHHAYADEEKVIEEWQSCKCSVCGRYDTRPYLYYFNEPNFCSWCGADMREGERNDS